MNSLEEIESGSFAHSAGALGPPSSIRVVVWNIERGLQLPRVIDFLLQANPDVVRTSTPAGPITWTSRGK
jgi:hypothetical protein